MPSPYTNEPNVWEEDGTLREEFNSVTGEINCQVTLRTFWEQRIEVISDILDSRREWPWIQSPNGPIAYQAVATPKGCEATVGPDYTVYEHAIIIVDYSNSQDVELVTENIVSESEFVSDDYRKYRWQTDNLPLVEAEAPGVLLEKLAIQRTIRNVALPIHTEFFENIGTVNLLPYFSPYLQRTFPSETLLYGDPVLQREYLVNGEVRADLTYKLRYQPEGWNKVFRGGTKQRWDRIVEEYGAVVDLYEPKEWDFIV